MRVIIRSERPHPGAQLRITDIDGNRITAFATNSRRGQLADLEMRHRRRARCEDRIRLAKDTGLTNLPLHDFNQNRIWCAIVMLACELIAWMQMLAYPASSRPPLGTKTAAATTVFRRRAHRPPRPANRHPPRPPRPLDPAAARRHPQPPTASRTRIAPVPIPPSPNSAPRQWNRRPPTRHVGRTVTPQATINYDPARRAEPMINGARRKIRARRQQPGRCRTR